MIPSFSQKVRNLTFLGLRENICDLLISSYVIEPYDASLYHVLEKLVPMLGLIMEHKILKKMNPTLVITKDNGGI